MNIDEFDILDEMVAVLTLAEHNIPPDIQELLVRGNPMRGIPPHALAHAIKAAVNSLHRKMPL